MVMKELLIPLAVGLAIFLFGMQVMRLGFEHLFLKRITYFLGLLTKTPLTGLLTGTIATALLQSSSAVLLLIIGLTHANLISFRQTIGLILGANIGTVVTLELLALDVLSWGPLLLLCGALLFISSQPRRRATGLVIGGFGLLFMGMVLMQAAAPFLEKYNGWALVQHWEQTGLWLGVLGGTLLTAVIQSSTATTAITMNLIDQQLISLPLAIAIVLGSNIGTCATALLGSVATNKAGRQVALAHLMLNLVGVLLFLPCITLLAQAVTSLTNQPMLQVAHAQLIFNLICSILALPFVTPLERLVRWITRDKST